MSLTFADDSFDVVVTSDIFEHIRHPMVGFAEVRRVLRPGGLHVFSIPSQLPLRSRTLIRVDTSGDEDVMLLDPAYHLGPGNSRHLVYNEFGRDLIDQLGDLGLPTELVRFDVPDTEASRLVTWVSMKRQSDLPNGHSVEPTSHQRHA
jgi:SAM-dependent methyltransferase